MLPNQLAARSFDGYPEQARRIARFQRLDAPGTVEVDLADNYGTSGLQVTGIRFHFTGCYSVTGSVAGAAPLTFVTRVVLQ